MVYVLLIESMWNLEVVSVHRTLDGALQAAYRYVAERWGDVMGDAPLPEEKIEPSRPSSRRPPRRAMPSTGSPRGR